MFINMRSLLTLALIMLSVSSHAIVRYTADWEGISNGSDITDNPPGGTSQGDWVENGQSGSRTMTITNGVQLSGSKVFRVFPGPGSSDIAIATNTKTAYANGMSFQTRIGMAASATRNVILYLYASGADTTTGPNESYRLEYNHGGSLLRIRRDNTILATKSSYNVADPADFTMKFEVDGSGNLSGDVDGVEQLTAGPDTTYTSGGFGVFVQMNNSNTEFTDLVVDDLTVDSGGGNDGMGIEPKLFENYSLLKMFLGLFTTELYASDNNGFKAETLRRWKSMKKRYKEHFKKVRLREALYRSGKITATPTVTPTPEAVRLFPTVTPSLRSR